MSKVNSKSKVSQYFMTKGVVITSDIWDRDKDYPKKFLPHVGYDYRASVGTKLYAAVSGTVVNVTPNLGSSYGRQVYIYDGNVTVHYAHLSDTKVKTGGKVSQGDLIGLSGASGAKENTYAAHLHLGLAKGKITNAGNKGSKLGDVWLDVEKYDFSAQKSNKEIAAEIKAGKGGWGNNPQRKQKLKAAGYDYSAIQSLLNNEKKVVKEGSKVRTKATRSSDGVKLDGRKVNDRREFTVSQLSRDKKEVLLLEVMTWVKVDTLVGSPEVVKVNNIGKYYNTKGGTKLYTVDGRGYLPSKSNVSYKIRGEANGRYKLVSINFKGTEEPNTVYVDKNDLLVSDKPRHRKG